MTPEVRSERGPRSRRGTFAQIPPGISPGSTRRHRLRQPPRTRDAVATTTTTRRRPRGVRSRASSVFAPRLPRYPTAMRPESGRKFGAGQHDAQLVRRADLPVGADDVSRPQEDDHSGYASTTAHRAPATALATTRRPRTARQSPWSVRNTAAPPSTTVTAVSAITSRLVKNCTMVTAPRASPSLTGFASRVGGAGRESARGASTARASGRGDRGRCCERRRAKRRQSPRVADRSLYLPARANAAQPDGPVRATRDIERRDGPEPLRDGR